MNNWIVFNEWAESNNGAWEYYKDTNYDKHELRFYKPDDNEPTSIIKMSFDEFEDLKSLFKNLNNNNYKNDWVNKIRKSTGMNKELCTEAFEKTNNLEDAISYVNKKRPKI